MSGEPRATLEGHRQTVSALAFDPAGRWADPVSQSLISRFAPKKVRPSRSVRVESPLSK